MRKIGSARQNGRKIYFTDETWLNSGHAHKKEWVDRDGLGRESKVAPGKGSRLIIRSLRTSVRRPASLKGASLLSGVIPRQITMRT